MLNHHCGRAYHNALYEQLSILFWFVKKKKVFCFDTL